MARLVAGRYNLPQCFWGKYSEPDYIPVPSKYRATYYSSAMEIDRFCEKRYRPLSEKGNPFVRAQSISTRYASGDQQIGATQSAHSGSTAPNQDRFTTLQQHSGTSASWCTDHEIMARIIHGPNWSNGLQRAACHGSSNSNTDARNIRDVWQVTY